MLIQQSEIQSGKRFVTQVDNSTGRIEQVQKPDAHEYIPLKNLLKAHLEQPGMMKAILGKTASNNNDGRYFKTKYFQDIFIPILLFNDDSEARNPLGSKKGVNKPCRFYLCVLCLPQRFQAS